MPEIGTRARADLPVPTRVALDAVGWTVGAAFGAVSRLRRSKSLHPEGVVYEATCRIDGSADAPGAATVLAEPAEHRAVVRFSRALGLPDSVPDLGGMAVRLLDVYGEGAHQDFLMVTTIDLPVLHHGFVPVRSRAARPYTSSLPYKAGDERFLVGAVPHGPAWFDLCVAPVMGRFRRVGEVELTSESGERGIRFDPWNTGGGLEPAGFVNRLRDYAYPLSQAGWSRSQ